MTARYDNQVGQASLLAAYAAIGRDVAYIRQDSPALHMAITTLHQVEAALEWQSQLSPNRLLELRFEDVLQNAHVMLQQLCQWLDLGDSVDRMRRFSYSPGRESVRSEPSIQTAIDPTRAQNPSVIYSPEQERQVVEILEPLRRRLGYVSLSSPG